MGFLLYPGRAPSRFVLEEFDIMNTLGDERKHDGGKARTDLVPPEGVEAVADVLGFGAKKYSANSWQALKDGPDRYYGAALRHLLAWRKGEVLDPESGRSHLAHAATNLFFLIWFDAHPEKVVK